MELTKEERLSRYKIALSYMKRIDFDFRTHGICFALARE